MRGTHAAHVCSNAEKYSIFGGFLSGFASILEVDSARENFLGGIECLWVFSSKLSRILSLLVFDATLSLWTYKVHFYIHVALSCPIFYHLGS